MAFLWQIIYHHEMTRPSSSCRAFPTEVYSRLDWIIQTVYDLPGYVLNVHMTYVCTQLLYIILGYIRNTSYKVHRLRNYPEQSKPLKLYIPISSLIWVCTTLTICFTNLICSIVQKCYVSFWHQNPYICFLLGALAIIDIDCIDIDTKWIRPLLLFSIYSCSGDNLPEFPYRRTKYLLLSSGIWLQCAVYGKV